MQMLRALSSAPFHMKQVFVLFENLKKAMDLSLVEVTYIVFWVTSGYLDSKLRTPALNALPGQPHGSGGFSYMPTTPRVPYRLPDVQQVPKPIHPHGT